MDSTEPDQRPVWSGGLNKTSNSTNNLIKFGLGTAAIGAAGFIPVRNRNVWDGYVHGMRMFEEYFFGRIPRTLQLSNIFSQFESSSLSKRIITPDQIKTFSGGQLDYLEKLTNTKAHILTRQGLRFESGKLMLARSGVPILENASIIRNINKSPRFSEAYARSLGHNFSNNLFGESLPFFNAAGKETSEIFQFIGGATKGQSFKRQLFGIGTELIERVNRLAKAPFEFPVIGPILSKLPFSFNVKSAGGLETLARLTGKLGLLGATAVAGYKYADYAIRNTDLLNNTIFDKGITTGLATIWAKANVAKAKFGELTGWTDYGKRQEEVAPGSTSLVKLSAFPIAGAIAGGGVHYLERLYLTGKLQSRGRSISVAANTAEKILKRFEGKGIISSIGRSLRESRSAVIRSIAESPIGIKATIGAAIGLIPILPFLPGAFAPDKTEQETVDYYSGKTEIAVRKGRFWEGGRTPYEGSNIEYYRPSWYARLMNDGTEKSIWGPLEKDGELSPWEKFYKSNFTYDLERVHYEDRPYPQTGRAFYDVPIIGPLLSATIGQVVKPVSYMHQDEFYDAASGKFKQMSLGFGQERNTQMGEELPGSPLSAHGIKSTIGEQMRRMTELTGLPGFLFNVVKKQLTGTEDLFDQEPIMASADTIDSAARSYYDENLGGMAGSNELFRRLLPHKRNQLDIYNPLRNKMPDWLPGPGDRSLDFQHGDPFTKVSLGEIRLPGEGYASRFSELQGVNPEDYPLIHKYKILADVAQFSDAFKSVEQQTAIAYRKGQLTDKEVELYHQTQEQLAARRERKTFEEYKYKEKEVNPIQQALTKYNEDQKKETGPSWFERTVGTYWEQLSHNAETSIEQLTPISPMAKLLSTRSAVEDYERMQVYGTENAFWDRPIANFINPFISSTAKALGDTNVPEQVKERRNLEEYFDILKYIKFTRLKQMAKSINDQDATSEFEQKRRETLFGINPYTYDYSEVFRALPRRDRDYFSSFSENKDIKDRAKILSLIPENEKGLYIAKWQQSDSQDFIKAVKLGILTDEQIKTGAESVQTMLDEKDSEGLPKTKELFGEYVGTRLQGESYPDWYRRTKLLPQKAEELGINIPGPDWVGYNPAIDLDDIKLKVVENMAENIQDYDLWPSAEKALRLKPFIDNRSIEPIKRSSPNGTDYKRSIMDVLTQFNISEAQVTVSMVNSKQNHVNMDIQEDRTNELQSMLGR